MDRNPVRNDPNKPSTSSKDNSTGRTNEVRTDFQKSRIPIAICSGNISTPRYLPHRQTPSLCKHTFTKEGERTSKINPTHLSRMDSKADTFVLSTAKRSNTFIVETSLMGARAMDVNSDMGKMQKDIQILQEKFTDLQNSYAENLEAMKELKGKIETETSKPVEPLTEMNEMFKLFEKENKGLEAKLQHAELEETNAEKNKNAELIEELRGCKDRLRTSNVKLTEAELQLIHQRKGNHEQSLKLEILDAKLKETKEELVEANSKVMNYSMAVGREKAVHEEIDQLRNCNANLQEDNRNMELKIIELENVNHDETKCVEDQLLEARNMLRSKDYLIKLLEERDELNQKLRAAQDRKIAHMSHEIVKMKEEAYAEKNESNIVNEK